MTRVPNHKIYTYKFDYRGQYSYSVFFTNTAEDFGVVHCDELIYLFDKPALFPAGLTGTDLAMSDRFVNHFVKFAKGQTPWQPTKERANKIGPYKRISDNHMVYYDDADVLSFWDQAGDFN